MLYNLVKTFILIITSCANIHSIILAANTYHVLTLDKTIRDFKTLNAIMQDVLTLVGKV